MPDLNYLFDNPSTRFDLQANQPKMKAVVTTGTGGYDKLAFRDVPVPEPRFGEVLVKVLAAGVNNTEINTRLGWYSSSVGSGTDELSTNDSDDQIDDGGWNEKTPFPLIQGTDCCGEIVSLTSGAAHLGIGDRVLVRSCMRLNGFDSLDNIWMASDFDGAFAQYVRVPATEVFKIDCTWSDTELATIPCAYGTAENMVHRAKVNERDHVLVLGASGGVGSAAVQLCKRRGARVSAVSGSAKMADVSSLGADSTIARGTDLAVELTGQNVTVVIDNVAGEGFSQLMKVVSRGGRYVSSGAIAGPLVQLDMRDFYLKDLNLIGCTAWDEAVFPNLISYIERDEIRPLVAKSFPLEDIAEAQQEFMEKRHFGNFVLIPSP
ncbi:MAG: alcohol dehydrogenase family protein [Acidiferrobacterales bacterium]|nr:alcohol dehydrogenase family protein [Acidiferrobacterales bacterium]